MDEKPQRSPESEGRPGRRVRGEWAFVVLSITAIGLLVGTSLITRTTGVALLFMGAMVLVAILKRRKKPEAPATSF